MAAGAGDHLMLNRLGLGEDTAETAGSSTVLLHESVVNALTFLNNGLLATAAGKVVALWDGNACAMKHTLNHEGAVNAIQLNHDGSLLATCGNDRKVTMWTLPKGDRVKELTLDGWVKAVTFSRNSEMLAAGGATAAVHLWDLPSYRERHALQHEGTVNAIAFTADGTQLASGGMDKNVRVWDTSTGAQMHALLHDEYVLALAFAPAMRQAEALANPPILAAGGGDRRISIWNTQMGDLKSTLQRDATVYAMKFSPTGDLLASGGGDKQASLWSRHGRLLSESPPLEGAIKALAFSSGGSELACASGKEVRLYTVAVDMNTGEARLKPHMNEEMSRIVNLPLLRATKEGDLDTVDHLLEVGMVDVNFANQHGDTPLILACWYGHKYIAARLLDNGAMLDVTNCDGNCALNVAAYRGNAEAVEMLLRHKATVDMPDHMTGKTALIKAAYVGHTPTAINLLDAKADVNHADSQGYTSLAFATSFNHEYMLQVLLHSDADPNSQDVFGITPLIHAAARGRLETVQLLLQHGARPLLVDSEGKTALDYAESAQFPDIVSELRDAAKLMPQSLPPSPNPIQSMSFTADGSPTTPRMTPRVPHSNDVRNGILTPRVPTASTGDMTARRLAASDALGAQPPSPSITQQQLSPLPTHTLSYLSKKLVHLSVMLEQDTVLSDTAYPTFAIR